MIGYNRWSFGLWLLVGFIHFWEIYLLSLGIQKSSFIGQWAIEEGFIKKRGKGRCCFREERIYLATLIGFPRYNMKCSGENVIQSGIFHLVSGFPLHFMLYCRNLDLEIGQFNRYFVPGKKGRQTPGLYEEKDEFILFFKSSWYKIALAARKCLNLVPQKTVTTFASSSVFILLLSSLVIGYQVDLAQCEQFKQTVVQ